MADLMASFATGAQAVTEAAQAAETYQDIKAQPELLKKAYESAGVSTNSQAAGLGVSPQDLSKVYANAQQMAVSQGRVGLADKFAKLGADSAKANLVNQTAQVEQKQAALEEVGRLVQTSTDPKEIVGAIDALPGIDPATKMQLSGFVNSAKDPNDYNVRVKPVLEKIALTAKERASGEIANYKAQLEAAKVQIMDKREQLAEAREARLAAGTGNDNIKLTGADVARTQRAINATGNIASSLEALNKFSTGTTTGFLPDLMSQKGMTNAVKSAGVRGLSSDEANEMNTVFTGIGRALATVETTGLATGLADLGKKMEQGIYIRQGDKPKAVAGKLADIRRITEESLQPAIDSGMLTPKQQATSEKLLERIKTAVPYTTNDVIDATRKPGAKTIGERSLELVKGEEKPPTGIDENVWKHMTPAEKELFKPKAK